MKCVGLYSQNFHAVHY